VVKREDQWLDSRLGNWGQMDRLSGLFKKNFGDKRAAKGMLQQFLSGWKLLQKIIKQGASKRSTFKLGSKVKLAKK
jgi:hypothetical protein